MPLGDRKRRLARLLGGRRLGIVLSDHTDEDGATIFRQACHMGLEGIVSKRLTAPYRSGPRVIGPWRLPRTKRTPQTQTGGARLHGPPCVPPATPASQRNAGLGTTLVTTATMGVLFAGGTGPAVRCRTAHSGVSPTVIPIFCSFGLIAAKASRKRSDGNVSSIAT
jgi:hypothetical protein